MEVDGFATVPKGGTSKHGKVHLGRFICLVVFRMLLGNLDIAYDSWPQSTTLMCNACHVRPLVPGSH